jgi:hypothetical protein
MQARPTVQEIQILLDRVANEDPITPALIRDIEHTMSRGPSNGDLPRRAYVWITFDRVLDRVRGRYGNISTDDKRKKLSSMLRKAIQNIEANFAVRNAGLRRTRRRKTRRLHK